MVINNIQPYFKNGANRLALTIKDGQSKFVAHITVNQWNNWTKPIGSPKGSTGMSYEDAIGMPCDIDFKAIGDELVNGKVTSENSIVDSFRVYTGAKALDYQATVEAKVRVAMSVERPRIGGGIKTPPPPPSVEDQLTDRFMNETDEAGQITVLNDAKLQLDTATFTDWVTGLGVANEIMAKVN